MTEKGPKMGTKGLQNDPKTVQNELRGPSGTTLGEAWGLETLKSRFLHDFGVHLGGQMGSKMVKKSFKNQPCF